MTARRIRTGFRRIGLAIAVVIGVPSMGAMLMSVPIGLEWLPEEAKFHQSDWLGFLVGGVFGLGFALMGYLATWTLGWILAGFAGEEEKS